jgi:acyl-CoA synthetase (AMP-forming)/AMP-acid ligase II
MTTDRPAAAPPGAFALPRRPGTAELDRISDYPGWWAARRPEAEAMVAGDARWSWRAFAAAVDRAARAMLAAGVGRGDRVAMLAPPGPQALICFLGAARIGALWTGLNTRFRQDELAFVVGDAEPALLVAVPAFRDRDYRPDIISLASLPSLRRVVMLRQPIAGLAQGWDDFLAAGDGLPDERLAAAVAAVWPDEPALLIYTSGSTGRPKGAMLSHRGLCHALRNQCDFWWAEPLRVLNNLPISNVFCIGDLFCWTMIGGGTTVFMERFEPRGVLETIQREKVTVWGQVPTMLQLALAEPDADGFDLSSLQLIFWAGARAPHELVRRLAALAPNLSTNYGLTETTAGVTYLPVGSSFEAATETVGLPHPAYELRVVGPDRVPLGAGQEGEIEVRGLCRMVGYWRRPEATAAMLKEDGWLATGDLGLRRPDGLYRIVGRLSDMFKSGGFNVYPREIELALESHPAVALAAVLGVPDPLYGEVGWAFVQPEPGAPPDPAALAAHARERLADFKVPKRILVRERLPLVAVGKVDKPALRQEARTMGAAA